MSLPTREIIEAYILRNCVDTDAANSLRDQRPDVQQEVLERGDVTRHRNPSAALQKHIKEAKLVMNAAARTRHAAALGEMQQFGPASGYGFSDPLYTYAVGPPASTAPPPPPAVHMLEDRPAARRRARGKSPSRSPSFGDAAWRAQQESPSPEKEMCANPIFGRRRTEEMCPNPIFRKRAEDDGDAARKRSCERSRSRKKGKEKAKGRSKQDEKDAGEPPPRRFQEEDKKAEKSKDKRKEKQSGKEQKRAKSEAPKGDREDGRPEDRQEGQEATADVEELRRQMEDLERRQEERRRRKEEVQQQLLQLQGDPGRQSSSFEEIRERIDNLQRRQDDRKHRREEVTRQLQKLEEEEDGRRSS